MWTPSVRSSFIFFTFFSFLCSAVSLRAALASSWALQTKDTNRRIQSYKPGLTGRSTVQKMRNGDRKTAKVWYLLLSLGHLRSDMGLNLCGILNGLRPQYSHQIGDTYWRKKANISCNDLKWWLQLLIINLGVPLGSGGGISPKRTFSCTSFCASLRVCLLSFFCSFFVR